jgi:oxalate decarboxylase/phosphoglucose isomerase-like protein (cupin superfamily)
MTDPKTRFITPDDVETQVFDWGTIKWLSSPRSNGAQRMAVGISVLAPGRGHLRHNHPGSEETVYVLSGVGRQMVEDETGQPTNREVVAGDVVHVPEGVFHASENVGWEPLRLLVTYAPAGPEEVLRELPGCTIIPPASTPER